MIEPILEGFLGLILECFIGLVWWLILFPVVWLLSLPFILIIALFRNERYLIAVTSMLVSVHCFWWEWGNLFTP